MDARDFYYQSLIAKRNREAQNPVLDAAAAGFSSGINNAIKSNENSKEMLVKSKLESQRKSRETYEDFVKKDWENYDHFVGNRLATPKESAEAFTMALQGQDYPGMLSMKKKVDMTMSDKIALIKAQADARYSDKSNSNDEVKNLNLNIDNLQKRWDSLTKQENDSIKENAQNDKVVPIDNSGQKAAIEQQMFDLQNKVNAATGVGTMSKKTIPGTPEIPAVKKTGIFGWDWTAKDTPAVPAVPDTEQLTYNPVAPNQLQSPQIDINTVKQIGNAALKAHYKQSATNPQTGLKIYSDDGINWFDESGKPIQ